MGLQILHKQLYLMKLDEKNKSFESERIENETKKSVVFTTQHRQTNKQKEKKSFHTSNSKKQKYTYPS